jgi:hypothetical protein
MRTIAFNVGVLVLLAFGCATSGAARAPTMEQLIAKAARIEGMRPEQVRARLGAPDETKAFSCGTNAGYPEQCALWTYRAKGDDSIDVLFKESSDGLVVISWDM